MEKFGLGDDFSLMDDHRWDMYHTLEQLPKSKLKKIVDHVYEDTLKYQYVGEKDELVNDVVRMLEKAGWKIIDDTELEIEDEDFDDIHDPSHVHNDLQDLYADDFIAQEICAILKSSGIKVTDGRESDWERDAVTVRMSATDKIKIDVFRNNLKVVRKIVSIMKSLGITKYERDEIGGWAGNSQELVFEIPTSVRKKILDL